MKKENSKPNAIRRRLDRIVMWVDWIFKEMAAKKHERKVAFLEKEIGREKPFAVFYRERADEIMNKLRK